MYYMWYIKSFKLLEPCKLVECVMSDCVGFPHVSVDFVYTEELYLTVRAGISARWVVVSELRESVSLEWVCRFIVRLKYNLFKLFRFGVKNY